MHKSWYVIGILSAALSVICDDNDNTETHEYFWPLDSGVFANSQNVIFTCALLNLASND